MFISTTWKRWMKMMETEAKKHRKEEINNDTSLETAKKKCQHKFFHPSSCSEEEATPVGGDVDTKKSWINNFHYPCLSRGVDGACMASCPRRRSRLAGQLRVVSEQHSGGSLWSCWDFVWRTKIWISWSFLGTDTNNQLTGTQLPRISRKSMFRNRSLRTSSPSDGTPGDSNIICRTSATWK